jgi:hypothetical protein
VINCDQLAVFAHITVNKFHLNNTHTWHNNMNNSHFYKWYHYGQCFSWRIILQNFCANYQNCINRFFSACFNHPKITDYPFVHNVHYSLGHI